MKLDIHGSIPAIALQQFAQEHGCIIKEISRDEFAMVPEDQRSNAMLQRHSLYTMAQMAAYLHVGKNTLFKKLRDDKILTADNTPYQRYINAGYFIVQQRSWQSTIGAKLYGKTMVTRKGYHWLQTRYQEVTA